MPIRVEIVSQDRMVYQGDADMVILPGEMGEMGILPNHAPLLSTLKFGILKVRLGGREEFFTVAGGVAEVQPDIVTVLADAAENVREIDTARAAGYRLLPGYPGRLAPLQPAPGCRPSVPHYKAPWRQL
jgi:F-type H+-transporting ATPase subunit epsilon